MIQPPPPHRAIQLFNRLGPALKPIHGYGDFHEAKLKERAVARAGVDDFGDRDFEEGLAVLCDSILQEANLTFAGVVGLEEQIINGLVTRLLRVQARKQGRVGNGASLNRPLIVVGLPRSGTTFLHRLLALDPQARALATWEVRQPIPPPGPDLRRWMTHGKIFALKLAAPGIDAKHRVDADAPEECMSLLDSSFRSPAFWLMAPVYGYQDWLLTQDMGPAYDAYREVLEFLQRSSPDKRFALKAPAHTANLEVLLDRIPEACLVQTHRDPVPIASSVCSLFLSMHGAMSHSLDVGRMAEYNVALIEQLARRGMGDRARLSNGKILDLQYQALVADPVAEVQRIYDHYGLPFTAGYEARLRAAVGRRKQGRFGTHRYRAEDFGMTDDGLRERFAFYADRFL